MKELIMDRGYLSGSFIGELKKNYNVDVLIPLKKHMDDFKDAFEIAKGQNWKKTEEVTNENNKIIKETWTICVSNMELWDGCSVKLNVYVSRTKRWSTRFQEYEDYTWALASTKRYPSEQAAIERYRLPLADRGKISTI